MGTLTTEQRKQAAKFGMSEREAEAALNMGMTFAVYAARRTAPADRTAPEVKTDEAATQADMFDSLARYSQPGSRDRLQVMADEAKARAAQLRAELDAH